VLQNSRQFSTSNTRPLSAVETREEVQDAPLGFGVCFFIWTCLIGVTWSGIALISSLF
jgi:hypothetical protein